MKHFLYLASVVVFLGACSQEPPVISEIFWQVNSRDDTTLESVYDQLSLFLHVDDEDGYDDLEYLYLVNDEQELFWEIPYEEWEHRERENEHWIGSNSIVMADFQPFPAGVYRVILVDKAGERMETEMYLLAARGKPALPKVGMNGISLQVAGIPGAASLWLYKGTEFFEARRFGAKEIRIVDIEEGVGTVYVYYYNNNLGRGVVSGPYLIRQPSAGD